MNICKTPEEYINAIALPVQKCCKRYGYLPSVLIAQSFIENGAGIPDWWDNPQIELLMKYNNMVGIKSELLSDSWADKTVWTGESLTKQTPEYYGGKKVTITDNFRKYDNIEQSFADFLLFIKYGAYSKGGKPKYGEAILSIKDPEKLITKVNQLGYATSNQYASHVMKVVRQYGLTKYDDLSNVEPTKYTPGYREKTQPKAKTSIGTWTIKKSPAYNKGVTERGNAQKFIAVHYLGVDGQNNALWDGRYGAHYVVYWDGTIYKVCDHDAVTWQVGTAGGTYKQKHPYARNNNCIGIEMCCHNTDGYCPETPTGEKHWYFTEATQRATAWLVRKLTKELNLDITHVLRHFDVVNKNCPAPYVYNNRYKGTWTWDEFLNAVKTGYCPDGTTPTPSPTPAKKEDYITVGARGEEVRQMQQMLIACGYSCGSYGADGIFGAATSAALKSFKVANGMENNDHYGEKTAAKLKAVYEQKTAKKEEETVIEEKTTPNAFTKKIPASKVVLSATQLVADTGRLQGWTYGNSGTRPPCDDHICSCDRGPSRANWLMGFRDQRQGGETCGSLDGYLTSHGWTKVTDKAKIKAGAIVAVRYTNHSYIDHVFQVVSYNKRTGKCTKYDFGSTQQIQAQQPFKNVPLLAWGANRIFVCAWNPPSWLCSASPNQWVKDGFDYSLVFNATYYLAMYPDLKKAYKTNKKKAFEHFIKYGMAEGRQATAGFNPVAYRERYPDLKKAFGKDYSKYYKHYCTHGFGEGRIGI